MLALQTVGNPDSSLKRAVKKLKLISSLKELELHHLVILLGVPNGSARNKGEREMSVLNIVLAHKALGHLKAVAKVSQLEDMFKILAIAEACEHKT